MCLKLLVSLDEYAIVVAFLQERSLEEINLKVKNE
jgi:hypothetical protein